MELTSWAYVALAVLVGGAVAWAMLRRGGVTGDSLLQQIGDAAVIAQTLVAAAEQMAETGTIEKTARFNYVFARLRELFPGLSEDMLIAAIEGAVWLVTKGSDLLDPDS